MKKNTLVLTTRSVKDKRVRDHSWWYLDGDLPERLGTDKATIIGGLGPSDTRYTIDWTEINGDQVTSVRSEELIPVIRLEGIYPVEIEGISEPCVGYFWVTGDRWIWYGGVAFSDWNTRGLVVPESDKEANERARQKMESREVVL